MYPGTAGEETKVPGALAHDPSSPRSSETEKPRQPGTGVLVTVRIKEAAKPVVSRRA